jgi:hypothetical protein
MTWPDLLGLNHPPADLTFLQIGLRAILVFIATLAVVRCGARRFLSGKSAFDVQRPGQRGSADDSPRLPLEAPGDAASSRAGVAFWFGELESSTGLRRRETALPTANDALNTCRTRMPPGSRCRAIASRLADAMHPQLEQSGLPPNWHGVICRRRSADTHSVVRAKVHSVGEAGGLA